MNTGWKWIIILKAFPLEKNLTWQRFWDTVLSLFPEQRHTWLRHTKSRMPNYSLTFQRFLCTLSKTPNTRPDICSRSESLRLKFWARVFPSNWDLFCKSQSKCHLTGKAFLTSGQVRFWAKWLRKAPGSGVRGQRLMAHYNSRKELVWSSGSACSLLLPSPSQWKYHGGFPVDTSPTGRFSSLATSPGAWVTPIDRPSSHGGLASAGYNFFLLVC